MKDGNAGELKGQVEPLVSLGDLDEYRQGLAQHQSGAWDDERWTAYRVRFGVYGQKQPGVQMVRIKIPGGRVPTGWLKLLAHANRTYAVGDAHITTRQDFQIYSVPLARTPDLLETLYSGGITTREACGNTLRNLTACALSGACGRERVDAGELASNLALTWLRHPLTQHMPRKVKITVSGCETDCGSSAIHDIGFIATNVGGKNGFKVLAGGGLGAWPNAAVPVLDFVTEDQLPTVLEAAVRLHHRYSNRRDRNASRIKFQIKRFGADKFIELFREEYARVQGLAQRPWAELNWRAPKQGVDVARTPVGVVDGHDGKKLVVVSVPLGLLSSDQLDALHDIAVKAGVAELRTTRDQNIAFLDVDPAKVAEITAGVKAIGLDVPANVDDVPDVVSCPGTTTCRIGITNSQSFGRHLLDHVAANPKARGINVRVSGCQNSCGLHHVADFGFHGMAKKVDGKPVPSYQLHIGGSGQAEGSVGIASPIIPAKVADKALDALIDAYRASGAANVRAWAEGLGKAGISELLKPFDGGNGDDLFVDWGDANLFPGAPGERGECAAPFVSTDWFVDLADDALINIDRSAFAGKDDDARDWAQVARTHVARRLLTVRGVANEDTDTPEALVASLKANWSDSADLIEALARFDAASSVEELREATAWLIDTAGVVAAQPAPAAAVGDLNAILAGID